MVNAEIVKQLQPLLGDIAARVEYCSEIDADRAFDSRAYAHVDHHPSVICVAHAFDELPADHQAGILLHEVGHLLCDEEDEAGPISADELEKAAAVYDPERVPEEAAANQAVREALGIEILYRDLGPGQLNLQYIEPLALEHLLKLASERLRG